MQQNKINLSGFNSTDKGSKSPKVWTMSSFFYKVSVTVQAKLGILEKTLACKNGQN